MDALDDYRGKIEQVLTDYAQFLNTDDVAICETIFERRHDHYLLVEIGWEDFSRVYGTLIHLDIIDGKVWIQHDGTEDGVAAELTAAGIPQERIVLAFQHPSRRKYSEFAAA